MKIQKSSNLNPFGGLNFVMEELDRQKIGTLLNQELPFESFPLNRSH